MIRAFIAKAILNISHTKTLIERLRIDDTLRRICGWEYGTKVPCEATFSNIFKEISESKLIEDLHRKLIAFKCKDTVIENISRDASAIEAREKPYRTAKKEKTSVLNQHHSNCNQLIIEPSEKLGSTEEELKTLVTNNVSASDNAIKNNKKQSTKLKKELKKRGRPKKGEIRAPKEPSRLEIQKTQTIDEMLKDLPKDCDKGCKKNAKGYKVAWNGYKLHADVTGGGLAISCILTSASVHDSQVSLPLEILTNDKVDSRRTLADAAYCSETIRENIRSFGKIDIIDHNPRRGQKKEKSLEEKEEYKERSSVERFFGDIKDNFAGRLIMVKGHAKVMCHLMLGILAHTALKPV